MGILDRLMGRRPVQPQDKMPEQPRLSDARTSVEWAPPEDLDPHKRDLAVLMFRTRRQVAELTPAEAMKRLGKPFGLQIEALVPLPGPARTGWSDARMFEALSRDEDHMTLKGDAGRDVLEAIDREMVRQLVAEGDSPANLAMRSYAVRADVTNNVADFMKSGPRLDERVMAESNLLEMQSSEVIRDRFKDAPLLTMAPMPDRGEARRVWMEDMLRAEHAAAHEGLMSVDAVVRAAGAKRGEVPQHWEAAPAIVDRTKEWEKEVAREAVQIERMSDASLRSRFRDVPGSQVSPIPPMGRGDIRREWIETALTAQKARSAVQTRSSVVDMTRIKERLALHGELGQSTEVASADRKPSPAVVAQTFAVATMMGR